MTAQDQTSGNEEVELKKLPDLSEQILIFAMGADHFAMPLRVVREVLQTNTFTWLPRSSDAVLGAVNHQGRIYLVLDLAELFGLPIADLSVEAEPFVLLLEGEETIGLRVGRIREITNLDHDELVGRFVPLEPASEFSKMSFRWRDDESVPVIDRDMIVSHLKPLLLPR